MKDSVKQLGWTLAAWGILSILFGLVVLAWPAITLKAFLVVLGIYLVVSGFVVALGSIAHKKDRWAGGIVLGLLSIVGGLFVLANPETSGTVLLYLVALWAMIAGVTFLVAGVDLGKKGIWLILAGVLSVGFGFYAFANPEQGALAIVWLIGVYNLFTGTLLVIASFNAKGIAKEMTDW